MCVPAWYVMVKIQSPSTTTHNKITVFLLINNPLYMKIIIDIHIQRFLLLHNIFLLIKFIYFCNSVGQLIQLLGPQGSIHSMEICMEHGQVVTSMPNSLLR